MTQCLWYVVCRNIVKPLIFYYLWSKHCVTVQLLKHIPWVLLRAWIFLLHVGPSAQYDKLVGQKTCDCVACSHPLVHHVCKENHNTLHWLHNKILQIVANRLTRKSLVFHPCFRFLRSRFHVCRIPSTTRYCRARSGGTVHLLSSLSLSLLRHRLWWHRLW